MKKYIIILGIVLLSNISFTFSQGKSYVHVLDSSIHGIVVGKNTHMLLKKSVFNGVSLDEKALDSITTYTSTLKKGVLTLQDHFPFLITMHYKDEFNNLTLLEDASVIVVDSLSSVIQNIYLHKDSRLIFENKVFENNLKLVTEAGSSVKFADFTGDRLWIKADSSSTIELNGTVNELTIQKDHSIQLTGIYTIKAIKEETMSLGQSTRRPYIDKEQDSINQMKVQQFFDKNAYIKAITLSIAYSYLGWGNANPLFSNGEGAYELKTIGGYNIHFSIKLKSYLTNKISLHAGIGYEINRFRFKNHINAWETNSGKELVLETDPILNSGKTSMNASYISLPFLLEWNIYKHYYFHTGLIGGLNINTGYIFTHKYKHNNSSIEERWGLNYHYLNSLKCKIQVGFGNEWINIYLQYALTPIFKKDNSQALYPYNIGLSIGL